MIADIPLLTYEKPLPVIPTDDDLHLQSYQSKLTLIRDYVRGVVLRFATGFFLCGNGGISKSHTVLERIGEVGCRPQAVQLPHVRPGAFPSLG